MARALGQFDTQDYDQRETGKIKYQANRIPSVLSVGSQIQTIGFVLSLVGGSLIMLTLSALSYGSLTIVPILVILASILLRVQPRQITTWGIVIIVMSGIAVLAAATSYASELDFARRYNWDPNGDTFVNVTRNLIFTMAAGLVGVFGGVLSIIPEIRKRRQQPSP